MRQALSYVYSAGIKLLNSRHFLIGNSSRSELRAALWYSQKTFEPAIGNMNKQAELGFQAGGDHHDTYHPNYTDESVDLIISEIVSISEAFPTGALRYDVLEVGSGPGKLTDLLSKKLPNHMKYLATEPSLNFLDVLKLKGLNVDVAIATADRIPLAENSVGTVVCAQSFNFFSEKENLESIHRVLMPGGKLILIWNMKQFGHAWMSAFYNQRKEITEKIGGSLKSWVNTMEWRKDIDISDDFKLLCYKSLTGINFQGNIETIISNLTTSSAYKSLTETERDVYVAEL